MASAPPPTTPVTAPAPSSPPSPPAASPPAVPPAPSPSNSTARTPPSSTSPPPSASPPPAAVSSPPPVPTSTPPPPTPAASPPTPASTPPPVVPSSPPPSAPSRPAPATPPASPSLPTPTPSTTTPSTPAPASPSSSPPPAVPSVPSIPGTTPSTPASPSTPPSPSTPATPSTPSPPAGGSPSTPSGRTPATPSPPRSSSSPSSPSSSSSISTPVVVGIAVGAVVVLACLSVLFFCCKKKKRRGPLPEEYYGAPPPMPPPRKDNIYGEQPQHWQHNVPPPGDHVVKLHPTPPPAYASRPPNMLPPPPPAISSSGGSGSNYSGSENILPPPSPGIALGLSQSTFTYEELLMATDGFSDANLLGQGGFGYVHRGVLRNGKEVAVKQLKIGSGQGEREFQAEVEIISRVHHKHLVSLVGYCITGGKRLLVYEFVPNNTLEFHLHGKGRPTMDWSTRLKIALGSAKGLAYLHEDCHPKIIHRDIKAANILLDFNFESKVADFGLAKFASDTNTHVSTRVMGTFGYLAPEYASTGKLTDKSDVFSFGVMLLEFITGQRPVDSTNTLMEESLVEWARPLLTRALEDGNYDALLDPRLRNNYNTREMARMVACAAACIRHSARRRPRMSQVVRALEGDISLEDLNEGVRPGQSSMYGSYGSSDYDSTQYNEDMKKFRKLALTSEEYGTSDYGSGQNHENKKSRFSVRTSQEYPSSEYSAATSEYGQNPSGSSSEVIQSREMETRGMKDSSGFSGPS